MTFLQWAYDHWLFCLIAFILIGSLLEDLVKAWRK
jgi:hypothetical protein